MIILHFRKIFSCIGDQESAISDPAYILCRFIACCRLKEHVYLSYSHRNPNIKVNHKQPKVMFANQSGIQANQIAK